MKAVITTSNCHFRSAWSEHGVPTSETGSGSEMVTHICSVGAGATTGQEDLRPARDPDHAGFALRPRVLWHPACRAIQAGVFQGQFVTQRRRALYSLRRRCRFLKRTRFIGVPDWGRPTLLTFPARAPGTGIAHKAIWVEPELLADIEYRAKSAEGKVRHPFFKGLQEDL
jgi:hypothetical protein